MPGGSVARRTGLFTAEELIATLPLRTTITLADRWQTAPEVATYILATATLIGGALASRPRATQRPSPPINNNSQLLRRHRGPPRLNSWQPRRPRLVFRCRPEVTCYQVTSEYSCF